MWDTHPLPPTIDLPLHPWSSLSTFQVTMWGVKTPGQCYIIWIIKYPFNPHPKQKLKRHSYNQQTSVQPSFKVFFFFFKNNLDTVCIQYRLIVRAAAAAAAAADHGRGAVEGAGRTGSGWYVWGISTAELHCRVCKKHRYGLQLCRQVWHRAGCCGAFKVCRRPRRGNRAFLLGYAVTHKDPNLVSGLIKEDVARLRVLGDFRSETVEFFYGLCIDFLWNRNGEWFSLEIEAYSEL